MSKASAIPYKEVNKSGDLISKNFFNNSSFSVTTRLKLET